MRFFKHHNQGEGDCGQRRFMRGEGRGRHMGRGGRLRRFLEHGDLRLLVLHLIGQDPRHGYELIREIETLTGGAYAPSPGVVYPTLTMLEELGQAEATAEGAKKLYAITEAGRAALAEQHTALAAILARLADAPPRETATPVLRAMENLRTALKLKLGGGAATAELARTIADLLDETTRKIEEA